MVKNIPKRIVKCNFLIIFLSNSYNKDMNEWKWNNGTVGEKSPRFREIKEEISNNMKNMNSNSTMKVLKENKAYMQSFETSDCCTELNEFRESNKREESWEKMATRQMVGQIGANPFLNYKNDYVNDVGIRDQFMKPINTSTDKIKTTEETNIAER